jgi:hypothetical protein
MGGGTNLESEEKVMGRFSGIDESELIFKG